MTNHKEAPKAEKIEEKVNQPAGAPIAPENGVVSVSDAVLAHQWQKDSPAIVTNELAGYSNGQTNIVADLQAADTEAHAAKQKTLSEEDIEFRSKLDVSDPKYVNPDLDHSKGPKD